MLHTWTHIAAVVCLSVPLAAQARAFGWSCNGHLGSPPSMKAGAPMIAGTKFNLEIDAVAPNASFMLIMGASNRTWSGLALPFDTGLIGFSKCFVNVGFDNLVSLTSDANGRLVLPIDATNLPSELRVYVQVVVPQPGGPKLAASQGYELDLRKSVKPFSFFVIPDTQNSVILPGWAAHFTTMTQWIVDNRVTRNSVFVSHVGDIVTDGAGGANKNQYQWDYARTAMARLDGDLKLNPNGVIPHSMAVGNRDYDVINIKTAATQFATNFGPAHYSSRNWWGGTGPDGRNAYQIFQANGEKYLHLTLEWRPRDAVISWARKILTTHPELPTILTTHQYLGTPTVLYDESGDTLNASGDNGGLSVRHKLVEPFPQIFFVACGHVFGGVHRSGKTILGQAVHEVLADYSWDPEGGNGWMNILACQPDKARIVNSCFSPIYKPGVSKGLDRSKEARNNATFSLDFHAHRRRLEATRTTRYTGGHDHGFGLYNKAADTFVSSSAPTSSNGTATSVAVNDPSGTTEQQGLIKFGGIFPAVGKQPAVGQVPRDRRIVQAILTLTTEGTGAKSATSSRFYELNVQFDESSTWTGLTGGIQVGTDTAPTPVVSTGNLVSVEGTRSFDVTASLRAWQAGKQNYGWAVLNSGADSWSFRSQEWSAAAERPMLTVIYER